MKLPLIVPKFVVKKLVVVALSKNTFLAKILVEVLLVVEAKVDTNLVEVEDMKLALDAKRLVEDASVENSVVEVLLVMIEDEAKRAPFRVSVFVADL